MKLPASIASEREHIRRELGAAWTYYREDLDQLLHLRWLGFNPGCIFDVGSSNTVWSVMAHLVFPGADFQLFEPLADLSHAYLVGKRTHPAVCRFLERSQHKLHPLALGQANGTCRFRWFEGNDAGSTSLAIDGEIEGSRLVEVPIWRLDDFVQRENLPQPDLIKLDTQGSELEIFAGATEALHHARVIFLETWLTKGYGDKTPLLLESANYLQQFGYDLFSLGDEYRGEDSILQTKDAVFVKRDFPLIADPALTDDTSP
jgi:FkbM family methyltransferase